MSNHNFVDSSVNNFTITRFGTASQGSFVPIPPAAGVEYDVDTHGGSVYLGGATTNYISFPHGSLMNPGTNSFTFEFWLYPLAANSGGFVFHTPSFYVYHNNDSSIATAGYSSTAAGAAPINTWTHYAICRSGTTTRIFINGTAVITANSDSSNITLSGTNVSVGAADGFFFHGYVAGMRMVVGTALYTSTFTPAVALTAVTNTKLLLKFANAQVFDSRCKTTPIINGSVTTDINTYKYGNASLSFDGVAGTYILIPGNSNFWMGTGDFTIETWIRPTTIEGNIRGIFGINTTGNNSNGFAVAINNSNSKLGLRVAGSTWGTLESTTTLSTNTWYHVALVRTGGNVKVYINGTEEITTTTGGTTNFTAGNFVIGRPYSDVDDKFHGFMDDFRVTKGVARYTANFTAPTTAAPKK